MLKAAKFFRIALVADLIAIRKSFSGFYFVFWQYFSEVIHIGMWKKSVVCENVANLLLSMGVSVLEKELPLKGRPATLGSVAGLLVREKILVVSFFWLFFSKITIS